MFTETLEAMRMSSVFPAVPLPASVITWQTFFNPVRRDQAKKGLNFPLKNVCAENFRSTLLSSSEHSSIVAQRKTSVTRN